MSFFLLEFLHSQYQVLKLSHKSIMLFKRFLCFLLLFFKLLVELLIFQLSIFIFLIQRFILLLQLFIVVIGLVQLLFQLECLLGGNQRRVDRDGGSDGKALSKVTVVLWLGFAVVEES
jgi:hypothetical protein